MADVHREVETTYAVDDDAALPALAGAVPRAHAVTVTTQRLRATYHDTVDLRLARAGLTLRRRTGGGDAGWHLKVPAGPGARSEIRLAPGRSAARVPAELERLVRARTRGVPLVPVARVTTARTGHRLVAGDGTVLVEVADDHVEGARLAGEDAADTPVPTRWREVEAELVDGDADDLAAVDAVLRGAGLRPVPDASKVRRVLDVAAAPEPTAAVGRSATAAEVVLASVRAHVERMAEQDLRVRLGAPGSVHAMRVATRRLRSALTTFGPLFLDDSAHPLRADLRRLAQELGAARDAEVLHERLTAALAADRAPDAAGRSASRAGTGTDVARYVDEELDRDRRDAHRRVLAELDGDRYLDLLVALDGFLADPALRHRGSRRARTVLPRLVERRWQRTAAAVERARAATDASERDALLHEARKAAKRARYATETVQPAFGAGAARFAAAMQDVQESLGAHHDAVVARARVHDLGVRAPDPPAAFALGRLHAQEEARAAAAIEDADAAWRRASRPALRRWLR